MILATTVIRNEIDILPFFLHWLEEEGVDGLLVIDNGSTDGSRELLTSSPMVRRFISDYSNEYPQARWMTELAQHAYRMGATWVVNADADEHWLNLKALAAIPAHVNTVLVPVFNMIPFFRDAESWAPEKCRQHGGRQAWKAIHRAAPGVKVSMGNHETTALPAIGSDEISVHHYAIRDYATFERKVKRACEVLPHINEHQCLHWRDWERSFKGGTLRNTYRELTLPG